MLGGRARTLLSAAIGELHDTLPPDDYFRLQAEVVQADLLELEQHFEESRELSLRVLPVLEGALGADHALSHQLRLNLAICELWLDRPERAEELFRADLARYRARGDLEGTRASRRDLHHWLGSCLTARLLPDEALEELETALELGRGTGLSEATIHLDIGRVWMMLSEPGEAVESFARARALQEASGPSTSNEFAIALAMADALRRTGRHEGARAELERAASALARGWSEPGLRHLYLGEQRAHLALDTGSPAEAERLALANLELARAQSREESLMAAGALQIIARARLELGRPAEALPVARECLELIERLGATGGMRYEQARETLARAQAALD